MKAPKALSSPSYLREEDGLRLPPPAQVPIPEASQNPCPCLQAACPDFPWAPWSKSFPEAPLPVILGYTGKGLRLPLCGSVPTQAWPEWGSALLFGCIGWELRASVSLARPGSSCCPGWGVQRALPSATHQGSSSARWASGRTSPSRG